MTRSKHTFDIEFLPTANNRRWKLLALALFIINPLSSDVEAACSAGNPNANLLETTPDSDFSFNTDGTVTHSSTRLVWDRCALGMTLDDKGTPDDFSDDACIGTATADTWQNMLKEVVNKNNVSYLGHDDWRPPNIKELLSIVESCGSNPSINQTVFPDTPAASTSRFWSATSYATNSNYGWQVSHFVGNSGIMSKTLNNHLRLVRGGQAADAFDRLTITTSMSLTSSPASPSTYGEALILTATVSGSAPSGAVVFGENGTTLTCDGGNQILVAGQATCILDNPAANSYSFSADYAGDAGNSAASASLGHLVRRKILTLSGLGADKVYDGSTDAPLTGNASLDGVINNDDVALSGTGAGTFSDADAGTDKTVTLTGFSLTGSSAGNYDFASPLTLTATISKAPQRIEGLAAAAHGGSATLSVTSSGATGNPVMYASNTPQNCTVDGNTMTLLRNGSCTVTANQEGNANYLPAGERTLNIIGLALQLNRLGSGTVSSDFSGIDCGSLCRGYFIQGETITLAATLDPSWETGSLVWGNACASSTGDSCSLRMDADQTAAIEFLCHFDSIPEPAAPIDSPDTWKCDALQATEGFRIIGPNGDVLFEARTGIELGPGFEVGAGGIFRALVLP
ncbi:Lcl domain-containing protein [Thiolapillus sp.]